MLRSQPSQVLGRHERSVVRPTAHALLFLEKVHGGRTSTSAAAVIAGRASYYGVALPGAFLLLSDLPALPLHSLARCALLLLLDHNNRRPACSLGLPSGAPVCWRRRNRHRVSGWLLLGRRRLSGPARAHGGARRGRCSQCALRRRGRALSAAPGEKTAASTSSLGHPTTRAP
jgi:hypothetical protein